MFVEYHDALGLYELYHDRAGELMKPWGKNLKVYCDPSR